MGVLTFAWLLQEVFLTEQHLCLVMDLADGGDLSSTIDRLRVQGVRNPPMHYLQRNSNHACEVTIGSGCACGCSSAKKAPT